MHGYARVARRGILGLDLLLVLVITLGKEVGGGTLAKEIDGVHFIYKKST